MDKTNYVLNKKPEPVEMVWAFDLGKGSIGEAVRRGNEFLHKASLAHPGGIGSARAGSNVWNSRQPIPSIENSRGSP